MSEIRGSKIRVSEIRVSKIRVSEIRVSEIRGSEIRGSEIRISSNHRELHGAIFCFLEHCNGEKHMFKMFKYNFFEMYTYLDWRKVKQFFFL